MNLAKLLSGNYIDIVKEFIEKIFVHEARTFQCEPDENWLIIYRDKDGNIEIGTYSKTQNRVVRMIPDKEVQDILMK
jgi:hypothetical protein